MSLIKALSQCRPSKLFNLPCRQGWRISRQLVLSSSRYNAFSAFLRRPDPSNKQQGASQPPEWHHPIYLAPTAFTATPRRQALAPRSPQRTRCPRCHQSRGHRARGHGTQHRAVPRREREGRDRRAPSTEPSLPVPRQPNPRRYALGVWGFPRPTSDLLFTVHRLCSCFHKYQL